MVYNKILPTFARGAPREDKWKCPEREAKGKLVTYGTKKKPHKHKRLENYEIREKDTLYRFRDNCSYLERL